MYRHLLAAFFLTLVGSLPARAQDDAIEASCVGIHEIALTVPRGTEENANDSIIIRVWHLDDFLANEDFPTAADPFYSYHTAPYYRDSRDGRIYGSKCAWTAETNWVPTPVSIPSGGREAMLPPNAPYVIEIVPPVVGSTSGHDLASRATFTFAFCKPTETDPRVPEYDAQAIGFYCPYEDDAPNQHNDLEIAWDWSAFHVTPFNLPLGGGLQGVSAAMATEFGAAHAEDWVLPYDYDAVCQAIANDGDPTTNCPAGEIGANYFLSPQVGYDYTFAPVDLDLRAPWAWTWTDAAVHSVRLQPGTKFIVEGDLVAEGVTLTKAGAANWGGVAVYASGSLNFEDVTVSGAVVGLDVYSDDVALSNTTLAGNGTGLRSSYVQNYCPGLQACLVGNESRFTLDGGTVSGNSGIGLLLRNARDVEITNTTVRGNGTDGLYLWNAEIAEFRRTHIEDNDGIGATVLDNADLRFTSVLDVTLPGLDRVANNGSHELLVSDGGYLFLGAGSAGGDNDVFDTKTPLGSSNRLLHAPLLPCCDGLAAEQTYWGSPSGPPPGAFFGSVDYTPYRTSPATSGSRPASPLLADMGETAGRGESPAAWLREAIRQARQGLEQAPVAGEAGTLARRLYNLQRLDPDDALAEHAPTMALLSALRDRLGQGALPAPLRAAAEAALVAEVHDALRLGAYAEAAERLAAFAPLVEGAEARRSLALARVMVAEQTAQHAEALALLEGVMVELEAEDPLRRSLLVMAETLAEQAGGEGRHDGSGVVARSGLEEAGLAAIEGLGAPYPNPLTGVAVVPLVLETATELDVAVYDMLGRRVATLAEGRLETGSHRFTFDASTLPAGVYIVRAELGSGRAFAQRVTLLR